MFKKRKGINLKELVKASEDLIDSINQHKICELEKRLDRQVNWIRFLLDELNYEVIEVSEYDYANNFRLYDGYQFVGKNTEGRNLLVRKLQIKKTK